MRRFLWLAPLFCTLALAACGSSQPKPAVGTQAYGNDNCLYTYTGGGWVKGIWCRRPINSTLTDYYIGSTIVYRVDESNALYYQWYDYISNHWYAQNRSTRDIYVETTDGRLLTPAEYAVEQAQQQAAPRADSTTPISQPSAPVGGTGPPPTTAPPQAQVTYQEEMAHIQEINNRIIDRILAPDCVGSYNGCR